MTPAPPASYELRSAGPNGSFGDGDDVLYSVAPQYTLAQRSRSASIVLGGLLPIGKYRFTVFSNATTSIHDLAGQALDGNGDGVEQGSYVRVFDIISPNQSPSFTKGADLAATDESGPQTIAAWATAISTGPPSEAAQSLTFVVTTDNDALFASLPSIDAAGKLSFTPAPNANGIVHVTIVLHDDGGTAAGGIDASRPQTFTITLTKVHAWHNTRNQYDVNGDRHVRANDVLDIINRINALQGGAGAANRAAGIAILRREQRRLHCAQRCPVDHQRDQRRPGGRRRIGHRTGSDRLS